MKRALIDPRSNRVCEIIDLAVRDQFAVAEPLFWTNADDEITDRHTYANGRFLAPTPPPPATVSRREKLEAALIAKGLLTEKEIDDAVVTRNEGRNLGGVSQP